MRQIRLDDSEKDADALSASIGARIRAARRVRGLSLEQLGGGELSRSFLSQVERGRCRISLRALSIVASRLDLPISHFLAEEPGAVGPSPSGDPWDAHAYLRLNGQRVRITLDVVDG